MSWRLHLRLICLVQCAELARAAVQCDEYARRGYCNDDKYKAYLSRHCPDSCSSAGSGTSAASQEDEACAQWVSEGYCEHTHFADYMAQNCPLSCGWSPDSDVGSEATNDGFSEEAEAEVEIAEEKEEEEREEEETAGAPPPVGGGGGRRADATAGTAAGEPENCAGWARQGLCDAGSAHADYMKQNCAATCASVEANGGAAAGASAADPMTCARWAMMGYCAATHTHAAYMHASCADACEKAALRGEAKAPPFDIWVLLLLCSFGALVLYAVKAAVERDGALSGVVKRHTLGVGEEVGPGKPNRSAMRMHKRSAKKT